MLTLRAEKPSDHGAIRRVHVESFPTDVEARLVDALRAAGHLSISLVAIEDDGLVGHVAFSPVTLAGAPDGIGLAPVAVLPPWRRRGIADRLIREGLAQCAKIGYPFVVVLGEPAYYSRFGFAPACRWGLRDEYGGGEAFQALELGKAAIPTDGGLVRYAPEFGVFTGHDK